MDSQTFDSVAKLFASRRLARAQATAGTPSDLAAASPAVSGLPAPKATDVGAQAASGSTPNPAALRSGAGGATDFALVANQTPGVTLVGTPEANGEAKKVMFLFLQSFETGSLTPKPDAPGHFTLTLDRGLGETIYFSDRPERVFGSLPTPQFLEALGFLPENPPNAALIGEHGDGDKEVVVLELFAPTYDDTTHTATYDVVLLEDWRQLGDGFGKTTDEEQNAARDFTAAHLFIDDCPDMYYTCYNGTKDLSRRIHVGTCWGWFPWANCYPCEDYTYRCYEQHPDFCNASTPCIPQVCGIPGSYC
jgi:hypothetical protein